jgi:adenylosuccinate lyase
LDSTIEKIKQLREETAAGMMDVKRALEESGGDSEGARRVLKERGQALAAKKSSREATEGLQVHPEKMKENLGATDGLLLSEQVTTIAAKHLGRLEAHELVEAASRRTLERRSSSLREELLAEPALREALSSEEIDAALDPTRYLGSADDFVDRALDLYRKEGSA